MNLLLEVVPVLTPEVVEDQEATLLDVVLNARQLAVIHLPEARLGHVGNRIREDLRVVQPEDVAAFEMRFDERDLLEDPREVALGPRVVVGPWRFTATVLDTMTNPDESEPAVIRDVLDLDLRGPETPAEALLRESRRRTHHKDDADCCDRRVV